MRQVATFVVAVLVLSGVALALSAFRPPANSQLAQAYDANGNYVAPNTTGEEDSGEAVNEPYYDEPTLYEPDYYPYDTVDEYSYDAYPAYGGYYAAPSVPLYVKALPGVGAIAQPIVQSLAPQTRAAPTPTCVISASPSSVAYGGSSVLQWQSANAQWATLTELGIVNTSGSWQFDSLKQPKTYTLNVSGSGGTGSCSAVVAVGAKPQPQPEQPILTPTNPAPAPAQPQVPTAPYIYQGPQYYNYSPYGAPYYSNYNYYNGDYQTPTCTLTVTPSSVYRGGSVDISWSSTNARQGMLTDVGAVGASGFQRITPTVSHPIVLSVSNRYTTNACSAYVTVAEVPPVTLTQYAPEASAPPRPTCSLKASPDAIAQGAATVLTWNTSGANSVTLTDLGDVPQRGTATVTPAVTGGYTLTAKGEGGARSCTAAVTVLPCPSNCASPVVNAPEEKPGGFWNWLAGLFTR